MNAFENAPSPPEMVRGPQTSLPEQREVRRVSRRTFLINSGIGAAGVLLPVRLGLEGYAADELVNDLAYPGTQSPIVTLGHETTPTASLPHVTEAANVYAGLGQRPEVARTMADKLAEGPYRGKRLSYTEYAPQGLNEDNLASEYEALESTLDVMHVFANSMGSITWANIMGTKYQHLQSVQSRQAARQTANQAVPQLPKHIKTLTFCGSPFDVEDTFQAEAVKAISNLGLSGTLSQKFLTKLVLAIGSDGRHTGLRQMLETAAGATFDELPPKMWASQIRQLGRTSMGMFARSFKGAITRDTLVMYLRPKDPQGDPIVKVDQASQRIGAFFTDRFGCTFQEVMMKDAGHADIDKACACPQFEDLLYANSGYRM